MTPIITQIKQIIEDEAKRKFKPVYHQSSYDENNLPRVSFISGAELLLPVLQKLLIQRDWLVECSEGNRLEKIEQLNQELLNTLKGETK